MGKKKKTKTETYYVPDLDKNAVYTESESEVENMVCPHYFSISGIITGCDLGPPDCEHCTNPDKKMVKTTVKSCSIKFE